MKAGLASRRGSTPTAQASFQTPPLGRGYDTDSSGDFLESDDDTPSLARTVCTHFGLEGDFKDVQTLLKDYQEGVFGVRHM
jgi:hypothetical protein